MLTKSTQQAVMDTNDRQKQEAIDLAMERNEQICSDENGHFLMGGSPRYQNMESIPYEIEMLYWQFEELAQLFSLNNELPEPDDVRETHFFLDTSSRVNFRYVKSMLDFVLYFIERASTPRYANALFNRHYVLRLKLSIDCWHDNYNAMFEPPKIQVAERIEELGTVSDIDALILAIDSPVYSEARVYAKAILVYAATFAECDTFSKQLLGRIMPRNWLSYLTLSQLLKYIRTESNLTVKSLTVNYQFGEEVQDKSKEKIVKLYRDIESGKANQEDISDEFLSYLSKTLKIPCYVLHELRSKIEKPVYEETLGYSLKKARLDCGLSIRGACKKLQEQQDQEKTFFKERWVQKKLHDARIRIKEKVKDNMVQELKNKELYGLYESHIDIARDYMDELCDIQFDNMSLSGGLEAEELIFRCTCQILVLKEMDKYVPHLTIPEEIKQRWYSKIAQQITDSGLASWTKGHEFRYLQSYAVARNTFLRMVDNSELAKEMEESIYSHIQLQDKVHLLSEDRLRAEYDTISRKNCTKKYTDVIQRGELSFYENNKRKPSDATLALLAELYNVPIVNLLKANPAMPHEELDSLALQYPTLGGSLRMLFKAIREQKITPEELLTVVKNYN